MEGYALAAAIAFEAVQVGGEISGIMKNGGALIPAGDDVEEGAGKIETRLTSHAWPQISFGKRLLLHGCASRSLLRYPWHIWRGE
jgi:hypothetical protein